MQRLTQEKSVNKDSQFCFNNENNRCMKFPQVASFSEHFRQILFWWFWRWLNSPIWARSHQLYISGTCEVLLQRRFRQLTAWLAKLTLLIDSALLGGDGSFVDEAIQNLLYDSYMILPKDFVYFCSNFLLIVFKLNTKVVMLYNKNVTQVKIYATPINQPSVAGRVAELTAEWTGQGCLAQTRTFLPPYGQVQDVPSGKLQMGIPSVLAVHPSSYGHYPSCVPLAMLGELFKRRYNIGN